MGMFYCASVGKTFPMSNLKMGSLGRQDSNLGSLYLYYNCLL